MGIFDIHYLIANIVGCLYQINQWMTSITQWFAIIAQALWKMMKTGLKDKITIGIFLDVFLGYVITGFNPVLFTIAGALAGFLLAGRGEKHA